MQSTKTWKTWEQVSGELKQNLTDEEIKEALKEYVVNRPTTYSGNYEAFYTLSAITSIDAERIASRQGVSLEKASREGREGYEQKSTLCRQAAYERVVKMLEVGFEESRYGYDNIGEMIICILGRWLPVPQKHKERIRSAEKKYFQRYEDESLKRWMGRFLWGTRESLI